MPGTDTLLALFLLTRIAAADPVAASELVWARPFALERPEIYTMTADRPSFDRGLLVELRVDPALLVPRQTGGPVLYVGQTPAFLFGWDRVGGCVVAFVPGELDLAATGVYFGSDELPERVDPSRGEAERTAAERAGVRPFPSERVTAALSAGGAPLRAADLRDVHAEAMARVAACTATPEDLRRSGVAPAPGPSNGR